MKRLPKVVEEEVGKVSFTVTNIPQLTREMSLDGKLWKGVKRALVLAMTENVFDLWGRSVKRAPVREGTLRASASGDVYVDGKPVEKLKAEAYAANTGETLKPGGMRRANRRGERVRYRPVSRGPAEQAKGETRLGNVVMGEVGFNTPYARYQHEGLHFRHPKGGMAKYLEWTLRERSRIYYRNYCTRVKEALR